ncbi:hypothetical protein BT93_F1030 [Corymbia citriodora subsp. variegata]|nr:hypothetical protein BT93_F1030 [Corymbia citriodora subsp. variegata]
MPGRMTSEMPLDHAVFQLSPKRSRCELIVSSNGNSEKLASGLVKPFVAHLKVAEEQFARAAQSIKLETRKHNNGETWFTKGTLERFVRFVSTPEVLELVNTFDAEMSQLEAARRIYSMGSGDQNSDASGGDEAGIAAADATKKELLRAIDVRLAAVRQDLTTACTRASATGFNPDSVSDLQLFADYFGANRLNEACSKFLLLCQRRPDLLPLWKSGTAERGIRSSCESDMSLDDPTEDQTAPSRPLLVHSNRRSIGQELCAAQTVGNQSDQSQTSTSQQTNAFIIFPTQNDNSNEKDTEAKEKKDEESPTIQTSQPGRRLSVQDRINLFESKQKETSNSGSGSKPSVGKAIELRRLSSDVSSAPAAVEKAVLRRWSGASDMSIDLNADKRENNGESPLCMPSSTSISQEKHTVSSALSEDRNQKVLTDSTCSLKSDSKSDLGKFGDPGPKEHAELQSHVCLSGKEDEPDGGSTSLKDLASSVTQTRTFIGRVQQIGVSSQEGAEEKVNSLSGGEGGRNIESVDAEVQLMGSAYKREGAGMKNQAAPKTKTGVSLSRVGDVTSKTRSGNRIDDPAIKDPPQVKSHPRGFHGHSRSFSGQIEGGIGLKAREMQEKGISGDQLTTQPKWRSLTRESEEAAMDLVAPVKVQTMAEESHIPKLKFQKPVTAASEQIKRTQGKKDEGGSSYMNSKLPNPSRKALESQDTSTMPSSNLMEQVQRVRQSKGNQELNDELKMKANELEKLFAEHKLRLPVDQSSSARRSKPADSQIEPVALQHKKSAVQEVVPVKLPEKNLAIDLSGDSDKVTDFHTPPSMKMLDNQGTGTFRKNFSDLSFSDDSRGKFYEKYMQKRDAKLREEWGSKRAEKEAKLKAMHDSLERSRAEMKAKFSGSAERRQSLSSTRQRTEKQRSFNMRSNVKEQQTDLVQSEEEEFEAYPDDGVSKSNQMKKPFPNRNLSSSTPRNSVAPGSRSSARSSNSFSGRRRAPLENPLAQSVPNFSDFRKENTKPSSGISKAPNRSQVRSYARSKSNGEDLPLVKEEKTRRPESLRKSSAGPLEFKDMSASHGDVANLASLEFDQEQMDHSAQDKFPKNSNIKFFHGKGNGVGPGVGSSIARKASMTSENLMNDHDFDDSDFVADESVHMAKEEDDDDPDIVTVQDFANGNSRLSQDSDDSVKSGSENDDSLRSISQVDPASISEFAASVPSKFHPTGSLKDSPCESPVSWNSRVQNLFSYPHETSDIDASMDSPIGSPASWNSHTLGQAEVDAARMRKKWGSAQKPFLVANSSYTQSRKDVTKGFKRLLKFGRKNRGTDSLVDWISATTSEGDDDTEDGRDPANRSSEDLRKSRMGFSQGHPSDDSFNESELNEQVEALRSSIPAPPANFKLRDDHISGSSLKAPRSFFSLSTFRSKGSDTKPR